MVDGPALYSPRVHAQSGSAGRYEFRVLLAEPGEYRVMIRLDFASDLGMCTCDAQHSVIRFQHLLSSRVEALSPPDLSAGTPGSSSHRPDDQLATPPGRWLRINCSARASGGPRPAAVSRYINEACDSTGPARALISAPGSPSQQPLWLYAPSRGLWRVLPFDFVPRGGSYWLHVEGDSTVLRGEKEDIVLLLNNGSAEAVHAQPVLCLDVWGNLTHARTEACGSPRARGYGKVSTHFVNLLNFSLENGGVLHVSYGGAGGAPKNYSSTYRHCRLNSASGVDPVEQLGALDDSCEGWDGVGAAYWRALFALGGDHTGRKRPDAIVVNFALHYASSETMCDGDYAAHWMFRAASLRKAFGDGAVVWHTGLATQFSDDQRVQGGSVGKSSVGHGWPREARTIDPLWSCRSNDRLWHMFDLAWPVAKRFGFHMLDGITVTAPWPHWTSDNRHYDGGINNEARQLGSITILNELLNLLSSAVKRPLRLTTGSKRINTR